MKNYINTIVGALFPTYDPTRTNLAGAIILGIAILLAAEYAY